MRTKDGESGAEAKSCPPGALAETVPPERVSPERIGRYELRFELASGGMGSVYLARLGGVAGYEKLVALKRIHPHLAKDERCVEMFLDEAKIASRITHPNVCSVFDFGEANGEYYLAMEYLVGEPLSRVYTRVAKNQDQRRDPLLPLKMARVIADACEGLHAAHQQKGSDGDLLHVVHRDVNPRNLFITYDGTVRVVDFGLASARERLHRTETGDVKGTMAYMAPEQLTSSSVDRRVDVWGLGVALWEGLAVRRLFKRDTTANTIYALMHEEIEPPSKHRPSVPKELDAIALKALARDPNERWNTAREMGQALRKFLATRAALIGSPELSDWMTELFPEGEARKDQLMELARMPHQPVLSLPVTGEFDVTQVATASKLLPALPAGRTARGPKLGALALGLVGVAALALLFGRGDLGREREPLSLTASDSGGASEAAAELERYDRPDAAIEDRVLAPNAPTEPEPAELERPGPAAQPMTTKSTTKRRAQSKPRKSGKPGTVNLVTRGGWAEVFKDGKSLGSTPSTLTLPPGRHKLVLKRQGTGAPKRIFVTVEAGVTKKVSVPLN